MKLSGRTAILNGASRGLGAVIAEVLARRGMRLLLAARSADGLQRVRDELTGRGGEVHTLTVDLANGADLSGLVDAVRTLFGVPDVLINNAAWVQPSLSPDVMTQSLAINLTAPMLLTGAILPDMIARGHGHIVNIASVAGLVPVAWDESYSASKHGLVGFTRSLRARLRFSRCGVRASLVCPGFVEDIGMYADRALARGIRAPWLVGFCTSDAVANAVVRCLEDGASEIVVANPLVRSVCAGYAAAPRLCDWLLDRAGVHSVFERVARAEGS